MARFRLAALRRESWPYLQCVVMTRFSDRKGMSQRERRVWGVYARRFMLDQLNLPTLAVSGRVLASPLRTFHFPSGNGLTWRPKGHG